MERSVAQSARELSRVRVIHNEVIEELKTSVPESVPGVAEIYIRSAVGALYVCFAMDTEDEAKWERLYEFEAKLAAKY